jgi:hypothetical protein
MSRIMAGILASGDRTCGKVMGFASAQPILRANVSVIQGLLDNGSVTQSFLPGINDLGVNSLSLSGAATVGGLAGTGGNALSSTPAK